METKAIRKFNADEILGVLPKEFMNLSKEEQRVAVHIYRTLGEGYPVSKVNLVKQLSIPLEEVSKILERWTGVYYNKQDEIIGFWGISITKMNHKLKIENQNAYAWCAWDAIFIPEIIKRNVVIESSCPVTKESISITITPEKITAQKPKNIYVSFLEPEAAEIIEDVVSNFCHYIYFFSSKEAGEKWVSQNKGTYLLTLDEVQLLSKRKNQVQFAYALSS